MHCTALLVFTHVLLRNLRENLAVRLVTTAERLRDLAVAVREVVFVIVRRDAATCNG